MAALKSVHEPKYRQKCFAVIFRCDDEERTKRIGAKVLTLGHAVPVKTGAYFLISDKEEREIFALIRGEADMTDEIVVVGPDGFTWSALSQKANFYQLLESKMFEEHGMGE